jgi:hypothetical protein
MNAKQMTIGGIVLLLADAQVRADLAALTASGGAIPTLQSKVAALEALIQTDSDAAINKFNEIVAFLAGLSDTDQASLVSLLNGKANASHTHTKSEISDFAHNHDDRYYTETEIDSLLSGFFTKQAGELLQKEVKDLKAQMEYVEQAGVSSFTLEGDSNPAFNVANKGAAERYIKAMGGYAFVTKNGTTYAAKLHPAGWEKYADGTQVSDASKFETMVKTPTCHFKGSGKTLDFGGLTPVTGGHSFDCPQWHGAYLISIDGNGKAHSRPGVAPAHSKTMTEFWNAAQALGSNWGLAGYQFFCLFNALYQARYGNLNSQKTIGMGWQHSDWQHCRDVAMGLTISLGDATGSVLYNDATVGDQHPTKLFGFEDLYSKLWQFAPGIRFYMDGSTRKAVVYSGNLVSNTANGRVISPVLESAGGQYATQMELGEYWDMVCQAVGGSDATYYCDGYWAATGGKLLLFGGSADLLARCGVAASTSDLAFSPSNSHIGARLAFFGTPTIVTGAELEELLA